MKHYPKHSSIGWMSLFDTGLFVSKRGGGTYFRLATGFSINEGQYPNISVGWGGVLRRRIYIALSNRLKLRWPR